MKYVLTMALAAISVPALGSVIVTQQAGPAPTYGTTLNFDEVGGPTGNNVPSNSWSASPWSIPYFQSGDGVANDVGDHSAFTGQGTNSYYGPWGTFIRFSQDVTAASFQAWDSSGPSSPFGGGMAVVLINDGDEFNPVYYNSFDPAYGGLGDSWFNITTDSGTVFDEIRIVGNGFFPESYVDNISWNTVPEPASLTLLLLGCAGLLTRRMK